MRKPWNLPSYPIYSLLTRDATGKTNYNIMSYVIPVSLHPKHYVIALYSGTQSLKNWQEQPRGILQFLAPSHAPLVRILGKKSGKTYNKTAYLAKKWLLTPDDTINGIAGWVELEAIEKLHDVGGDHELYLCRVNTSKSYHDKLLTTDILIQQKIIL